MHINSLRRNNISNTHGLQLTVDSAVEIITIAEAKIYIRVDGSDEDSLITDMIKMARLKIESYTSRAFINQTFDYFIDMFPSNFRREPWWDGTRTGRSDHHLFNQSDFLKLPKSPVTSITSISTFAADNTETTFDASNFRLDNASVPARIVLNDNAVWPSDLRDTQAVKIVFVAGYGATAADVPALVKQATYSLVAHYYENRGDMGGEIPTNIKELLNPLIIWFEYDN